MTEEQRQELKEQLRQGLVLTMLAREAHEGLPDSPFVQLLKMAAHAGQAPLCQSCKHRDGVMCLRDAGEQYAFAVGFCHGWELLA